MSTESERVAALTLVNARLKALIGIRLELAFHRDSDRLLQGACEAARDLFGATYVALGIVRGNDWTTQRVASCGVQPSSWTKPGDSISEMLRTVVRERRTLRGDSPGGDPIPRQLPPLHPQALLAAPIASPTQVYGWFCLVGKEGSVFSEDDEYLVTALSEQVGRIYESGRSQGASPKPAEVLESGIPEPNRPEDALRTAEERMRFALEAAGIGIWDMDYTTGVLRWSEILESQYGLQPGRFAGTFEAFTERIHPDDRKSVLEAIEKAVKSGGDFSVLNRSRWPDGTVRCLSGAGRIHCNERGEPVRGIGISMDVTELRTLEEQYHQAQKMEAIGRLAGGVAHDFNNLLAVILGYTELLLARLGPDDPSHADISRIQRAGASAEGLTRQLLAFSRKEIVEPKLLNLNVVVAEMRPLLERLIREDVKVMLNLLPELALISADHGQLEQIILNLAVNAQDAMPGGGKLLIETANVELDENHATTLGSAKPGPHVALVVTDTGTGMTPQVRTRIFEPFFTTKEPGKGTGFGLATVHDIVARSGGTVSVRSAIGSGTSFSVYFPRADSVAQVVESLLPVPRPPAGTQTVLVVDDEEGVREATRRLLEWQGYEVLVAASAEEAIELFERHASIDVLLTDVIMPRISGPDLARRLIERRPGLKVIYISGYTDEAIVQHGVLNPETVFLHKPFTSEALGRKIHKVLHP